MATARYCYWTNGGYWLGYFEDFPDYLTQGESFDDLKANLKGLYQESYERCGSRDSSCRRTNRFFVKRTDLIRKRRSSMQV